MNTRSQAIASAKRRQLDSVTHMPPLKPVEYVDGYPDWYTSGSDVYFTADVETDGPIPGPYSMLSFALVYAGAFDGRTFFRPPNHDIRFYVELKPISSQFEWEALQVNGLDREKLIQHGVDPADAMTSAAQWIKDVAKSGQPVLAAYPLSFDWSWLYWYFVRFSDLESPFGHSRCFDIKTAIAVKLGRTIGNAGRQRVPDQLKAKSPHTHHALDDAVELAEILGNIFAMERNLGWQLPL